MTSASAELNRQNQAQKIISDPSSYKICEGCGSIVTARTHTCPSCHGYRFDGDETRVVNQAKILASRRAHSVIATDLS